MSKLTLTTTLLLVVCTACTTPAGRKELLDTPPGYRPPLDTDEAGLWMQMDNLEKSLKTSGSLVRDPELNHYVYSIVCHVAGPHCADIRVYLVRIPEFNASMAPNGVMQIWTGLLLRAQNEAQLAYVIGHELGHYLRKHSLQIWRDVRQKSTLFAYFNLLSLVIGVPGYVHDLAQLATLGGIFKFSRDSEREADEIGFELTTALGYDPREAGKLWEALIKEQKAAKDPTPWVFFSTHPPTEERIEKLNRLANEIADKRKLELIGKERYLAAIEPWRMRLIRDELQQRRFARTEVVLNYLLEGGMKLGEVYYFRGELYRLRGERGDEQRAKEAYQKALEYPEVPAEAYRTLGLLYLKSNDKERARTLLQRYLELKPQAEDQAMVSSYLDKAK